MKLFEKKKDKEINQNMIGIIESDLAKLKYTTDVLGRDIMKLEQKIPALVREAVFELCRKESISAVTRYRDNEFITQIVADRTRELEHKKRELEIAIEECEKALAKIKEENEK